MADCYAIKVVPTKLYSPLLCDINIPNHILTEKLLMIKSVKKEKKKEIV